MQQEQRGDFNKTGLKVMEGSPVVKEK